jgi:site-specific DNA-methyltransferase (adenine-specific)
MKKTKLMLGDNIQSLKKLPDNSIDSIVTDPPYGLSFMNKKWDYDVPSVEFWKEVLRVLKPGGHVLSFGGTRTYHRMVVGIEDAGFEIRDQIMWLYGSGFPKSHNIGKAVDKLEGNHREVVGEVNSPDFRDMGKKVKDVIGVDKLAFNSVSGFNRKSVDITKGQSQWEGWGTALKPANEPICVARKPLSEKSVAENVLKWGTGGINIDGCRIEGAYGTGQNEVIEGKSAAIMDKYDDTRKSGAGIKQKIQVSNSEGRFPANIILDEIAGELLDEQSGVSKSNQRINNKDYNKKSDNINIGGGNKNCEYTDKGGASRFFYQAKVSKAERNMGLDHFDDKEASKTLTPLNREEFIKAKNNHPTVKPVSLMAYLCRLVTPVNGIVLDPFMGSGSTGIAAQLEGFRFCGMEMDGDYFKIAEARIENYESYRNFLKKK